MRYDVTGIDGEVKNKGAETGSVKAISFAYGTTTHHELRVAHISFSTCLRSMHPKM